MTSQLHTVEKIGGTSMSNYEAVRDNIIVADRSKEELYQRIFVVSAYAGVTNELLEHKKTGEPGVYALFADAESDWAWGDDLTQLIKFITDINSELFEDPMLRQQADQFITDRIEGVRGCLIDLQRLCSYGQFQLEEHLLTVREMLAGIGEAHSAFNTTLKLQQEGINARFVDLTGWRDTELLPLDEKLKQTFESVDLSRELPIVTGYAQCKEGLMRTFDRGYSEMTFSRVAVMTDAREAIIHKEYHLSSADPNIVGADKVVPLGRTNYDVADQLANLGMEAIHPRAGKGLRQAEIPLRVMNTFEPEHTGTLITGDYVSEKPQIEIIAGAKGVFAIEVFDQDMQGEPGSDRRILDILSRFKVRFMAKDTNANTITHYVGSTLKHVKRVVSALKQEFPNGEISTRKVAVVSAIGSDIKIPDILVRSVKALADEEISVLAMHQCMRQVDIQFVVDEDNYEKAIIALHGALVEPHNHGYAIVAA
ncbi:MULTISPECIES: aspartate kinase [Marinobacter]|uniref:aspartate kinase n=1 Tax=Marinobacter xiaoshiensis TaxID=3073652 RepID=A0ABU2HE27_9GAMM|nr:MULTISPECIES: aspartate kinase [unclassified Marinobacter]MBK1872398.1 aspartate kinase [Marinobacter sp. 1-3A]MBK1887293.1 aspartate kinase [Marinobacter sp. DY40_1A1]MDS1308870.1 aspartate kinase [Marinobacter sp. F60267]